MARRGPFHIEHPSRGVLTTQSEIGVRIFRFSWSKPRNDPSTMKFATLEAAWRAFDAMPHNKQDGCSIRQYDDEVQWPNDAWVAVYPVRERLVRPDRMSIKAHIKKRHVGDMSASGTIPDLLDCHSRLHDGGRNTTPDHDHMEA